MNKIIALLIFIIVLLIGGIVYFIRPIGLVQKPEKQQNNVATEEITQPEVTTQETIFPNIPPKADFTRNGTLINKEGDWIFLYDEPGKLALTLKLEFTNISTCDFGEGKKRCDERQLEEGTRVKINGYEKNNELTVIELEQQN